MRGLVLFLCMTVIGLSCSGWANAEHDNEKSMLLKRLLEAERAMDKKDSPPYVNRRCWWLACLYQVKAAYRPIPTTTPRPRHHLPFPVKTSGWAFRDVKNKHLLTTD